MTKVEIMKIVIAKDGFFRLKCLYRWWLITHILPDEKNFTVRMEGTYTAERRSGYWDVPHLPGFFAGRPGECST